MEAMKKEELQKEFKIGEQTKKFFEENMKTIITASCIIGFMRFIIDMIGCLGGDSNMKDSIIIITFIALLITMFFCTMSMKVIAGNWYLKNTKMSLKEAYKVLEGKKLTLIISSIIKSIKIGLWSILLIIPGIYKTFSYIFNEDFIIFNDAKSSEAIKLSKQLSKKNILEIFIYYLVVMIMALIPTFIIKVLVPILLLMGLDIVTPFISFVANIITYSATLSIASGITMKFIDLTKKIGLELNIK
ncbi:hypothetical protein WG909_07220 [Peptostreptococcaceae bacterium AGR-M142]